MYKQKLASMEIVFIEEFLIEKERLKLAIKKTKVEKISMVLNAPQNTVRNKRSGSSALSIEDCIVLSPVLGLKIEVFTNYIEGMGRFSNYVKSLPIGKSKILEIIGASVKNQDHLNTRLENPLLWKINEVYALKKFIEELAANFPS